METKKMIINEATGLAKNVYEDVAQPVLSEVGKTAGGITRVLLSPLNGIVWGFDKIIEKIEEEVSIKLSKTPNDKKQTPPAFIAVPAIEALRYTAEIDDLRNLYNNLIANAMDADTVGSVHPSFVDILKNLTPDEAKLLGTFLERDSVPFVDVRSISNKLTRAFSTVEKYHSHVVEDYNLELTYVCKLPIYFDNLLRIGILSATDQYTLEDEHYIKLEQCKNVMKLKGEIESEGEIFETKRGFFALTNFGREFINVVIRNK
jgi:hypothetical protein